MLCCVDDAQWLDRPSAEALLFAVRRLEAERIAVLLAVREGDVRRLETPGLPMLELAGLDADGARELLAARLGATAPPDVVASLLQSADGNPLALLELPVTMSDAPAARGAVEEEFRARVATLPEGARRLLLLAAADEAGDVDTVRRAATRLGLDLSELGAAEQGGLVRVDGAVAFRHPLVRSAVYRSAPRDERRAAHEALAAVVADPVRSVWHRALVVEGADEGLASELEVAAAQAAGRGAAATASAAFERAADLTDDRARRGHRLRCAAQASLDAGRPDAALALVERARPLVSDPLEGAQLALVSAGEAARRGSPAESHTLLREAGAAIARLAPAQAFELVLWSLFAGFQGAWAERVVAGIREEAAAIPDDGELARFGRPLLDGAAALAVEDAAGAREPLLQALAAADAVHDGAPQAGTGPRSGADALARSAALMTMSSFVCFLTADFPTARRLLTRAVGSHRQRGAMMSTAGTLPALAHAEICERRLREAGMTVAEGLDLARQAGYENDEAALLAIRARIAALQGREEACREDAATAMRRALAGGVGWATNNARVALAELELGMGDPRETLDQLGELTSPYFQPMAPMAVPDLIDAALRLDERDRAVQALERLEAWAPVSGAPQVREVLGRSRAVLAEDPAEADRRFAEVLELPAHTVPAYERARSQLAYGERLRRDRRRSEARIQLRTALDTFEGLGMDPWADRARAELTATGEKARKRDASTVDDLTPQELRIAQLVAAGATNRDVAAQIFVSPKTVQYHLRKVFLKLGVSSRVELARLPLGEDPAVQDEAAH